MKLFKSLLVAPATLGLLAPMSATANELNLTEVSDYSSPLEVESINDFNPAKEIAITNNIESFHIDISDRISVENNSICHKPLESELVLKRNFIPEGKIKVGITSGASTPDKIVADVIEKLIAITK